MIQHKIYKNTYIDSVTLMSTTSKLKKQFDLEELIMLMGTDMNKEMIQSVGLYQPEMDDASTADLILAVKQTSDESDILENIFEELTKKKESKSTKEKTYHRIEEVKDLSNIAVISVPGIYAALEAKKALNNNLHVMMFSDNVSIEDEIKLKDLAIEKDLLMMGPDCGTSILNGIGLCFANKVQRGNIGLVAASGTGLQEVSVLIDKFGGGISQAIGVGGRDLSEQVGGRMMLHAIDALAKDPETHTIVLISKPPHKSVEENIVKKIKTINKPIVVCFLDSETVGVEGHITYTNTLAMGAEKALEKAGISITNLNEVTEEELKRTKELHKQLSSSQTALKGLFCGGTLTSEALSILRPHLDDITSNVAKKPQEKMENPLESSGHNLVDLGDDLFTNGKPHPMIEPTIRLERILKEAKNKETAVLLLDFELGFGSHDDPVGVTIETLKQAQELAKADGRNIAIVAYVLGTNKDKQNLAKATEELKNIGAVIAKTNAHAAILAANIIKGGNL